MSRASPGPVIWAVFFGAPAVVELVAGLRDQGARVALIGDTGVVPGEAAIDVAAADREALASACEQARDAVGLPDLVLHACIEPTALIPTDLDALSAQDWNRQAQAPLKQTLWVLQTLRSFVEHRGCAVTLIGPSLSLIGAPRLAALTSALEGQRGLMKSAARQWGVRGVRFNWLALAPEIFAPALAEVELPLGPELGPPPLPLGRRPDLKNDAAGLLMWLASPAAAGLTGATLNLDGGEWMLP